MQDDQLSASSPDPKNYEKELDKRKSKVDMNSNVFGKPNVLIRNNPNFTS